MRSQLTNTSNHKIHCQSFLLKRRRIVPSSGFASAFACPAVCFVHERIGVVLRQRKILTPDRHRGQPARPSPSLCENLNTGQWRDYSVTNAEYCSCTRRG